MICECHKANNVFFFFNDTATTEIYTLSLHDALPIFQKWKEESKWGKKFGELWDSKKFRDVWETDLSKQDRKSTRLNSSHGYISYAVFCLKKKKKINKVQTFNFDNEGV